MRPSIKRTPADDAPVGGDGPAASLADDFAPTPAPYTPAVSAAGWWVAATLWRRRWWLVAVTAIAAGAAVAVTLQMPNWYHSETRVLLPESGGSSLAGLVETVAPGASALIGGGDDYTRFRAILTSRTVMEDVVRRFNLIDAYEVEDEPDPLGAATAMLREKTQFEVSLEFNYLAVHVLDKSPEQAAQIANRFVEQLNTENMRLTAGSAAENRRFLEVRLGEAEDALDAAQLEMQRFMERNDVVGIEQQAEALVQALATAQAQVATAEIQFEAVKAGYGPEAPEYAASQAVLAEAKRQVGNLTGGGEAVMPVPMRQLPALGREYAEIEQEVLTQAKIIEAVRPLFEQARLSERREAKAVQVIDPASVPVRKAEPRRSVLVVVAALSAFILTAAFLLALALVRLKAPVIASKLRTAS